MKIVIGADPLGFELKEKVKKHLEEAGHEVLDVGTVDPSDPVLYIEVADKVAKVIQNRDAERGIVMCGTGMGVSIIANKHKGVYCACVESQWTAKESRIINNANVIAFGGRLLGEGVANDMVDTFINTEWLEGCNETRRNNLSRLFGKVVTFEEQAF